MCRYEINDVEYTTPEAIERIECAFLSDNDVEQAYIEILDEVYEEVELCGCRYQASEVLRAVDPVAYREGLLDHINSEEFTEVWQGTEVVGYVTEEFVEDLEND